MFSGAPGGGWSFGDGGLVQIILLAVAGLFVSENSGLRVNTLMAGVSISGAVVALSSQALLQDLFAFFAILMDVPFVVGDKIRVGASELGTVRCGGVVWPPGWRKLEVYMCPGGKRAPRGTPF